VYPEDGGSSSVTPEVSLRKLHNTNFNVQTKFPQYLISVNMATGDNQR